MTRLDDEVGDSLKSIEEATASLFNSLHRQETNTQRHM